MKAVCTPVRDSVNATFAYDLASLFAYDKDVFFLITQGSLLSAQRNSLVTKALEMGATHVLFIDSDMRFPANIAELLGKRDKDIIGANCIQRGDNTKWTAFKDGQFVQSQMKRGEEEVDSIGMGVTLIKREVFEKMKQPWFFCPFDKQENRIVGEDVYFCTLAREAGFSVFVDHDVTAFVKHGRIVEL